MFATDKNAFRKTKILNTIGPKTESAEMMEKLIKAGSTAFRFNFSHDTVQQLVRLKTLREVSAKLGVYITAIADTQGPKHRVGMFENDFTMLEVGQKFIVDLDKTPGNNTRVNLPHGEVISSLIPGATILIDDGKIQLKVVKVDPAGTFAETEVTVGGKISNRKGFNIPDVILKGSCLTEKDRADLELINSADFDYVALSFVQTAEEIREIRHLIAPDKKIIVKIEKPSAMVHLREIAMEVDAIMVARGDLAVEIGAENVPAAQKEMIRIGRDLNKPVVVATMVMESMIENMFPTRAEVSDCANAVLEGADCIMTSAETAMGAYPVECVAMIDKIIRTTEASEDYRKAINFFCLDDMKHSTMSSALAHSVKVASNELSAKAIVSVTASGMTAIEVAKNKPLAPIFALSLDPRVLGFLGLCGGVKPLVIAAVDGDSEDGIEKAAKLAVMKELHHSVKKGDHIVVSMGKKTPGAKSIVATGTTNTLQIIEL